MRKYTWIEYERRNMKFNKEKLICIQMLMRNFGGNFTEKQINRKLKEY